MRLKHPELVVGAATPDVYERKQREQSAVLTDREDVLVAYANEARWVADCPRCGAGIVLHVEWPVGRCMGRGCGSVYANVQWPEDFDAIEVVLDVRPLRNQNWLPTETVADLVHENRVHFQPRGGLVREES